MSESLHQLQWRGKALGPWTLDRIREALASGEVHSLHQINVEGRWLLLRDHLESVDAVELERRAASLGDSLRRREEPKAGTVKPVLGRHPGGVSKPDPYGRPPPVFVKTGTVPGSAGGLGEQVLVHADEPPTCWMAVIAFVVACAGFVPYLNLVCWLPGIVLGHLALRRVKGNPQLEGRGLALGALIIGYATLAFAFVTAVLAPVLFYRVFPVGDI